ncbi:hypothetical protein [Jejuia pallidilutea]|uniref:PL28 ulvan lyase domain-containing protein n=1 Tax=Jejuia pallidilutea TaxID=504487 RepID=A0A090W618_9FLAO|nr:hypothetical protein [Jejuia pallidilutea]GAL67249.1 hypothetical protein JCM19301_1861 [Jejuia pallidilutea]GAL70889.1 hypothetical protein JCM19302_2052 [Jejuia pallidilutea]GAL89765.1 hypothetical protein JCM19538_3242 [Jejuia pallidilutea]
MKKQLKFLKKNLLTGLVITSLIIGFGCSDSENLETDIESEEVTQPLNDDNLTGKKTNPKRINTGCDNPRKPGTNEYYRQYTADEIGLTDLVPDRTSNTNTLTSSIRFLDDRTCAYNYDQSGNYGIYRLRAGSNGFGSKLQPRIERSTIAVTRKNWSFVEVKGTVRIVRVGSPSNGLPQTSFGETSGTYIMQAKGNHANQQDDEPKDPAILLVLAKPAPNGKFNIYAERVTARGGTSADERVIELLTTVDGNTDVPVLMKTGWTNTTKQYVTVKVGNAERTFDIPNTKITVEGQTKWQTGSNAKIRFGAYRCKNGEAEIRWRDVRHRFQQR